MSRESKDPRVERLQELNRRGQELARQGQELPDDLAAERQQLLEATGRAEEIEDPSES